MTNSSPSLDSSGLANSSSPPPPAAAACVRYDLPKSPPPPPFVPEPLHPVEVQDQQDHQPILNHLEGDEEGNAENEVASRAGVTYSRQQTREDTSSLALNSQPQEVGVTVEAPVDAPDRDQSPENVDRSLQGMIPGIHQNGSEDHSDNNLKLDGVTHNDNDERPAILEDTSSTPESGKSLLEEMQQVEGVGAGGGEPAHQGGDDRSGGAAGRSEDDYVAQEEVEEYLERMKQDGENYVDEQQVIRINCLLSLKTKYISFRSLNT